MDVSLQRLMLGRDGRSQWLTGLRGVGKTVLLNEFEQIADGRGWMHEHLEVTEDGNLAPRLAAALRRILLMMDAKQRIGERVRRALGVLKAFTLRLPGGPELSIDVEAVPGPADSGDLALDLAGLFVELGQLAGDHGTGVLLTADELHFVGRETLEALVIGLHRASQLRLPITVAGAGLPSLVSVTGEAKSYSERMFLFPEIGSLSRDQAVDALVLPAADEGVEWQEPALDRLLEASQGYPYFLQEFGKQAWDVAEGPAAITLDEVERAIPVAIAELDDGFFRARTGRTTDPERAYLRAMTELGPGPVRTAEVAALLGRKPTGVTPIRDTLIKKALCYSPRWGELDFTVPMFGSFMRRLLPDVVELSGDR